MSDYDKYHEQAILVSGFLGGILFAGLVLVVQSPNFILDSNQLGDISTQGYLSVVSTFLGMLSDLASVVCITSMRALSSRVWKTKRGKHTVYNFVDWCLGFLFVGFALALGLIVLPVNFKAGIFLFAFTISVFSIYAIIRDRERDRQEKEKLSPA